KNILWFGTAQSGLNRTVSSLDHNSTLSFISYKHDPNDPSSLLSNSIPFILKDNSGVFWIASYGQGLNIYNSKQKQFRTYKQEPGNPFSIKGEHVTSMFEDINGTI